MKYLKIILLKLLFFIPISSSFGAVTFVDSQVFEDGSSTVINGIAFNDDGTPDSQPDPAKTDNDFKEHQFSVSDLPPFTAFALKITMTGTNSSYPPLIKDLRGIALAV